MEQCPIKEMEITFQCVQDIENSLFEPIPAKKVRPEWFKKIPTSLKIPNTNRDTETIKKCPAMQDWMNMGYLIRNRHTVLVILSPNYEDEPISIALALKDDIMKDKLNKLKSLVVKYNEDGKRDTIDDIVDLCKTQKLLVEELQDNYVIGGHPAAQTTGSGYQSANAYSGGFTGNGQTSGEHQWVVPEDAPDEIYYQCEFHPVMFGKIIVID